MSPGGRPSMGPVSPAFTPSNAVLSGCWVVLAWAVGAGLSAESGFRGRTSKRGMGWVKAWTLGGRGLGGNPVGMLSAKALRANGLRPFCTINVPAVGNSPILIRSRRETWPWGHALRISRRFLWAFSASLSRALEALRERYIRISPSLARVRHSTLLQFVLDASPFADVLPTVWRAAGGNVERRWIQQRSCHGAGDTNLRFSSKTTPVPFL